MIEIIDVEKFLELALNFPIFDVRAPLEYEKGHIPGAINLPLFSDEQRAVVGLVYAQEGKGSAISKGLEFVGPKMNNIVEQVKNQTASKTILIHCWRGGMRSKSIAWLLDLVGYNVYLLEGGYKNFRNFTKKIFEKKYNLIVIGGPTGSGKTKFLEKLSGKYQVIDLEFLANHRGSAFGGLGKEKQITQQQFENNLAIRLLRLNFDEKIFIEDESLRIGTLFLPKYFFELMRNSNLIFLEIPLEERIKNIKTEYAKYPEVQLEKCIETIKEHLGGTSFKNIINNLKNGKIDDVISQLLVYYDKKYNFGLLKRDQKKIFKIPLRDLENNFDTLVEKTQNYSQQKS